MENTNKLYQVIISDKATDMLIQLIEYILDCRQDYKWLL
jgi:hypothetical protein